MSLHIFDFDYRSHHNKPPWMVDDVSLFTTYSDRCTDKLSCKYYAKSFFIAGFFVRFICQIHVIVKILYPVGIARVSRSYTRFKNGHFKCI